MWVVRAFLPLVAWTSHHMWGVRAHRRTEKEDKEGGKKWKIGGCEVIVPECGSEWSADGVKRCTHIWNSLSSCTWREELLRKASVDTFSFSLVPFLLSFFFFSLAVSKSFSLSGLCLLGRWNDYPLSISREERVDRSEREEERRDEAQEDSNTGEELWGKR